MINKVTAIPQMSIPNECYDTDEEVQPTTTTTNNLPFYNKITNPLTTTTIAQLENQYINQMNGIINLVKQAIVSKNPITIDNHLNRLTQYNYKILYLANLRMGLNFNIAMSNNAKQNQLLLEQLKFTNDKLSTLGINQIKFNTDIYPTIKIVTNKIPRDIVKIAYEVMLILKYSGSAFDSSCNKLLNHSFTTIINHNLKRGNLYRHHWMSMDISKDESFNHKMDLVVNAYNAIDNYDIHNNTIGSIYTKVIQIHKDTKLIQFNDYEIFLLKSWDGYSNHSFIIDLLTTTPNKNINKESNHKNLFHNSDLKTSLDKLIQDKQFRKYFVVNQAQLALKVAQASGYADCDTHAALVGFNIYNSNINEVEKIEIAAYTAPFTHAYCYVTLKGKRVIIVDTWAGIIGEESDIKAQVFKDIKYSKILYENQCIIQ